MKDIIEKLPPCPTGRTDCEFRIRHAVRTAQPFDPSWDRDGNPVETDPNETVGVLECSECMTLYEYRFDSKRENIRVKPTNTDPEEIPVDQKTRQERVADYTVAYETHQAEQLAARAARDAEKKKPARKAAARKTTK